MAKLKDSKVYGNFYANAAVTTTPATDGFVFAQSVTSIAGTGFSNMATYWGTGPLGGGVASITFTWQKSAIGRIKVTLVGAGGGGSFTNGASAGIASGGGGSGAVGILIVDSIDGTNNLSVTFGAPGGSFANAADSTLVLNGVTYTAGGGKASGLSDGVGYGLGGTATGAWTFSLPGMRGQTGGQCIATQPFFGGGADTPLGFGQGGCNTRTATGSNGANATGFGGGGAGGHSGTGTGTVWTGGTGGNALCIIEY